MVLASLLLGVQDLAPGAVLDAVRGARTEGETAAIVSSRIDRTVIALVVGASVALSGVVLQGLTRNPIAEPGILGLNSGAALAVVLGISFLGLDHGDRATPWPPSSARSSSPPSCRH